MFLVVVNPHLYFYFFSVLASQYVDQLMIERASFQSSLPVTAAELSNVSVGLWAMGSTCQWSSPVAGAGPLLTQSLRCIAFHSHGVKIHMVLPSNAQCDLSPSALLHAIRIYLNTDLVYSNVQKG